MAVFSILRVTEFISGILFFSLLCLFQCVLGRESCCTYCCDTAADTKFAVLRLGLFHTAQSSQMLVERILPLYLIVVIYFIREIYMNRRVRKGWVMAADALFPVGSFETSFEHGFRRSSRSHSHIHLP